MRDYKIHKTTNFSCVWKDQTLLTYWHIHFIHHKNKRL